MNFRLIAATVAACIVVLVALSVRPPDPIPVTVGQLSDSFRPDGFYRVSNANWGVRHGDYVVFMPQIPTRHPVVIRLRSGEPADSLVYVGSVRTIRDNPLPGCPGAPPFCLVDDPLTPVARRPRCTSEF